MNILRKIIAVLGIGCICCALAHRFLGDDTGAIWMMAVAILDAQALIMTKPEASAFR